MPDLEWHSYDYSDKTTAPPREMAEELVWIVERYAGGVDVGYFDGFTFRTWSGSDDCHVTHWAEMAYPEPPEGWDKDAEEDD